MSAKVYIPEQVEITNVKLADVSPSKDDMNSGNYGDTKATVTFKIPKVHNIEKPKYKRWYKLFSKINKEIISVEKSKIISFKLNKNIFFRYKINMKSIKESIENKLTYPEFLTLLIQDELLRRDKNQLTQRLKRSGLKSDKTIETNNPVI